MLLMMCSTLLPATPAPAPAPTLERSVIRTPPRMFLCPALAPERVPEHVPARACAQLHHCPARYVHVPALVPAPVPAPASLRALSVSYGLFVVKWYFF